MVWILIFAFQFVENFLARWFMQSTEFRITAANPSHTRVSTHSMGIKAASVSEGPGTKAIGCDYNWNSENGL